jgi:hypothetical protein
MKKAYKEAKRPMGIYRITSMQRDIAYIGVGIDLAARINRHKAELRFGTHRNRELQTLWNRVGENAFTFEVLDLLDHQETSQTDPAEELPVLLEMWIRTLEKEGYSIVTL